MRIKVESGGKLFHTRKQSILTSKITVNKVDDMTYEVNIENRIRVVSVRLPYQLYEYVDQYARDHKTTISDVIRKALSEYLRGG